MPKKDLAVIAFGCVMFLLVVPALMAFVCAYLPVVDFMPLNAATTVFAGCSSAVGLLFIFWSMRELWQKGKGGPAVIGPLKLNRETKHLVTTGPYAVCRNPMHLGLVLYYLGACCAINSIWSLAVPLAAFITACLFARFVDEPRLRRDFGQEYETWAAAVPRFWPRVKKN